jgi:hypothetical protein
MNNKDLELRLTSMEKTLMKYGKYIEELEKDVAIVKANSHPPIFKEENYKDILVRLEKIENKEK